MSWRPRFVPTHRKRRDPLAKAVPAPRIQVDAGIVRCYPCTDRLHGECERNGCECLCTTRDAS